MYQRNKYHQKELNSCHEYLEVIRKEFDVVEKFKGFNSSQLKDKLVEQMVSFSCVVYFPVSLFKLYVSVKSEAIMDRYYKQFTRKLQLNIKLLTAFLTQYKEVIA